LGEVELETVVVGQRPKEREGGIEDFWSDAIAGDQFDVVRRRGLVICRNGCVVSVAGRTAHFSVSIAARCVIRMPTSTDRG
jgi:hypothetical protein